MILQGAAGEGVERGKGLVHQQHLRTGHQGPHDGDALCLPTGEFARPARAIARQPDLEERFLDEIPALGAGQVLQAEGDILGNGQPGQQAWLLEHDANGRMRAGDRLPIHLHEALGRRLEPAHQPQERRLAAAGPANEADDFAGLDGQRHRFQRLCAVRIDLAQVRQSQHVTGSWQNCPASAAGGVCP